MPAAVIIPARYASTRFPGKALAPLNGKPLIQHVYERAGGSALASEVVVATDSEEIFSAVASFGGRAVMTSPDHASGTDRVAEAAAQSGCDIIVNVQGDEPLIRAEAIDAAIGLLDDSRADIGTVAARIKTREEISDPNVVKVAMDGEGFALYFSRAPIPYHRDRWKSPGEVDIEGVELYRHVGIYGFRREALLRFSALEPTALERTERLEQLRALEHGMRIKVGITDYEALGVDTPEDLERVRKKISVKAGDE
jgi:3-deoxy-manno-octulosonate cytidylyltransferase (CMP-KDO synthetase)